MQFGEISFCQNLGYNLKDDNHKKNILDDLEKKFGFKVIQKHHDKFDVNSPLTIKRVTSVPHLISTKTNGNPYMLFLTRHNNTNQCIFIDKKIQHGYFTPRMIMVKLWFKDNLFQNTLFDGEMVRDKNNNWMFVINDIIAKENTPLYQLKLVHRINILYDTLKNAYYDDESACCCMSVKKYFTYDEIPNILNEFIPKLNYTCRGLYFKPIYSNFRDLLLNFDESLIKNVSRQKFTDLKHKSFFTAKEDITEDERKYNNINMNMNMKHDKNDENMNSNFQDKNKNKNENENVNENIEQKLVETLSNSFKTNQCVFCVRKTKVPDVYEMQSIKHELNNIEHDESITEIACIQNKVTSNMMRKIFGALTFLEKKNMLCTLHPKFKKWVPIEIIE